MLHKKLSQVFGLVSVLAISGMIGGSLSPSWAMEGQDSPELDALCRKAHHLMQAQMYQQAGDLFSQYLNEGGNDKLTAHMLAGKGYYYSGVTLGNPDPLSDFDKAKAHFQTIFENEQFATKIASSPSAASVYSLAGMVFTKTQDWEPAAQCLSLSITSNPHLDGGAYLYKEAGYAFHKLGRTAEAAGCFKCFIDKIGGKAPVYQGDMLAVMKNVLTEENAPQSYIDWVDQTQALIDSDLQMITS